MGVRLQTGLGADLLSSEEDLEKVTLSTFRLPSGLFSLIRSVQFLRSSLVALGTIEIDDQMLKVGTAGSAPFVWLDWFPTGKAEELCFRDQIPHTECGFHIYQAVI